MFTLFDIDHEGNCLNTMGEMDSLPWSSVRI